MHSRLMHQGLDTAEPSVEIGGHSFRGSVEESVGTDIVFDKETHKEICRTMKKIKFKLNPSK